MKLSTRCLPVVFVSLLVFPCMSLFSGEPPEELRAGDSSGLTEATPTRRHPVRRPVDERLQPSDLHYAGAFRLPEGQARPRTFEYGGNAMTYVPSGDPQGPNDGYPGSLLITGHDRMPYGELPDGDLVAEVSIPAPVISRNVEDLPRATMLQDFADVSGGLFSTLDEIPRVAMQYISNPLTGPLVHLAWGQHFQDSDATAIPSHAWFSTTLSSPGTVGAWTIGDQSLYSVNGYMLEIPSSWADANTGGRVLGTGRFRDGGWSGMGPALFAVTPWQGNGSPHPPGTRLSERTLLLYASSYDTERIERCLTGYQHPDEWEGAAWITGTSGRDAVVFAGTKGTGAKYWYGYINPQGPEFPCVDGAFVGQFPVCRMADGSECPAPDLVECEGHVSGRGWWSARFDAQIIFYAPSDLAAVSKGALASWAPQPYAVLDIDDHLFLPSEIAESDGLGLGVQRRSRIGEITFDRTHARLYVLELFADGAAPVVHVFRVE